MPCGIVVVKLQFLHVDELFHQTMSPDRLQFATSIFVKRVMFCNGSNVSKNKIDRVDVELYELAIFRTPVRSLFILVSERSRSTIPLNSPEGLGCQRCDFLPG